MKEELNMLYESTKMSTDRSRLVLCQGYVSENRRSN